MIFISAKSSYKSKCSAKVPPGVPLNRHRLRIAMQNKSGKWEIPVEHLVPVTPPSVQIHYNGNSHWVTSFQFKDDDRVFLVDTLFASQDPTMSLKIQLTQIYGKGRDKLEIIAPFVKSQVGGNDCGAFAIANLVEFGMGNFWRDKDSLSSRGDLCQDTLRSHLVTCFEKQKFSEFMARSSYGRKSYKSYSIDTNCSCGLPNEYDDNMVLCNGCGRWFHHVCAGVGESSLPDVWLCFECEQVGDDVIGRSPRYVWDPSKFVIIIWLLVCMCAFPRLQKLIIEGCNHGRMFPHFIKHAPHPPPLNKAPCWQTSLYKVHLQLFCFS